MEKRLRNTLTAILLAAAMLLTTLCPVGTVWAEGEGEGEQPTTTSLTPPDNVNKQNYGTYGSTVKSYLECLDDGRLMSVQYVEDSKTKAKGILVEYYSITPKEASDGSAADEAGEPSTLADEGEPGESGEQPKEAENTLTLDTSSTKLIAPDYPSFGGFFATDNYYFILTGENNKGQDSEKVAYHVRKYDHDWNSLGEAALRNCNTTVPFSAGSARMDAFGKYLLIRTCHSMYKSKDGYNHQANVTLQLDIDKMEFTDSLTYISNAGAGYISHSFNQFIKVDEAGHIVAVDHGDCYPRGLILSKYKTDVSKGTFRGGLKNVNAFPIYGAAGNNNTGTSVGGFAISSTSYLIAGNSVFRTANTLGGRPRDVFVTAVDKASMDGSGSPTPITTYLTGCESGSGASTPHLVRFDEVSGDTEDATSTERYVVLWSEGSTVYCKAVDASGKPLGEENTNQALGAGAALSDCVPVVSGSSLIWYTRSKGTYLLHELSNDLVTWKATDSDGTSITATGELQEFDPDAYTPSDQQGDNTSEQGSAETYVPSSGSSNETSSSSSSGGPYTVSFNANGGTIAGTSVFATTSSGKLSSFPTATRDGYTFEGWYTAATGGTRVDSSTQFTQGTQLYAHWKEGAQEYTITFDANGGTLKGSATQSTVQQKLASLPTAERDDYTFQGWQTADGASVAAGYQFRQDTTVYAQWAPQASEGEYTITLNANGGTIDGSSSVVTVNQKLASLPSASRDGYTFKGWYDSASGGTQILASRTFHADATIYAQWAAKNGTDAEAPEKVTVKKATLQSVKSKAKGKITVSWKQVSGASGYQVAYSKTKSFPSKKTTVKNVNAAYSAKTFSGLSKGKTYYVRVRAYKKADGKKSYGKWSSIKKVAVKK